MIANTPNLASLLMVSNTLWNLDLPNVNTSLCTGQKKIPPKFQKYPLTWVHLSGQMVHNISPTDRFPWNFRGFPLLFTTIWGKSVVWGRELICPNPRWKVIESKERFGVGLRLFTGNLHFVATLPTKKVDFLGEVPMKLLEARIFRTNILGCHPSKDSSGKWRFTSGSPTENRIILVVTGILETGGMKPNLYGIDILWTHGVSDFSDDSHGNQLINWINRLYMNQLRKTE